MSKKLNGTNGLLRLLETTREGNNFPEAGLQGFFPDFPTQEFKFYFYHITPPDTTAFRFFTSRVKDTFYSQNGVLFTTDNSTYFLEFLNADK